MESVLVMLSYPKLFAYEGLTCVPYVACGPQTRGGLCGLYHQGTRLVPFCGWLGTLSTEHGRASLTQLSSNCVCLRAVDHPFVASLYGTIQTGTHLHFLMEYCEGGELYGLLTTQPTKRLKEAHMRFYVAEVRTLLWSLTCVFTLACK